MGFEEQTTPDGMYSKGDQVVRKLLCIGPGKCPVTDESAQRLFSTSITISALRCLLSYVVFPVITPIVGVSTGVGPYIGIPIALLALYFDVLGIRRFWLASHRLRWPVTFIYLAVIGLVLTLLVGDVVGLA